MPPSKPLDVVLAMRRTPTAPAITHDRLGRPLVGPCLIWTGKLPKDGYPRLTHRTWRQVPQLVHRVAYALATGHPLSDIKTIPELDHLCRTPACSAFGHLEPVTRKANLERGNSNPNERKTHCDKGHEFTADNTYAKPDGTRECRECKKVAAREWYRRKHRPDLIGRPPSIDVPGRPRTVFRDPKPRRNWQGGT